MNLKSQFEVIQKCQIVRHRIELEYAYTASKNELLRTRVSSAHIMLAQCNAHRLKLKRKFENFHITQN